MNFFLRIQLFSNSVSRGLVYFEQLGLLHNVAATSSFCKIMNDVFDAVNRTSVVTVDSTDMQVSGDSVRFFSG